MKIVTQPITFVEGANLAPEDLNAVFQYASDGVADAGEKRYREVVLPISFERSAATGYTNADGSEVRSFRFKAPVTCYISRGYLTANLVSSAAVNVTLRHALTNLEPQGATDPWLSTDEASASAAETITDFCPDRIRLEADEEYVFRVESTGTFVIERFDVMVHLLVDRWTPDGVTDVPRFAPTLLDESHGADADVVTGNVTALGTETAKFTANKSAPVPVLYVLHGLTSSTDVDLVTFPLPRFDSARASAKIAKVYAWASFSSAPGSGSVFVEVLNALGASIGAAIMPVAGQARASASSTPNLDLTDAVAGISASGSQDYAIQFASSAPVVADKVYALVWFDAG